MSSHRLLRLALLLVFALGVATVSHAQEPLASRGTVVTTEASTPVFPPQGSTGRVITVPAGTSMKIIGLYRSWYMVTLLDSRGLAFTGLVAPATVTLQPGNGESAPAGKLSQRGFIEGRGAGYVQKAPNDAERLVADGLFREEVFAKPTKWFQMAAGLDLRANSYGQVEDKWRLDFEDRTVQRPRAAVRRLAATLSSSRLTVTAGKQFIRWGRADIVNPTDRFAPRDYLNVLDADFLPVLGGRSTVQVGQESFEGVYLPRMTPSRTPLFDQRWTVLPAEAAGATLSDGGSRFPTRSQVGGRWNHVGSLFESSVSIFDGVSHLPAIDAMVDPNSQSLVLTREYRDLRTYGADLAIPTRAATFKAEAAYFTSPSSDSEEYVLYVIELERQIGEWLLDGGYAGDVVTKRNAELSFSPERGIARSFIARASYTVDPRRSLAIEGAVRQNGRGLYVKGEFSQAMGQHWRLTVAGIGIGGRDDDFLGQYHRNSHLAAGLRYSF